MSDEERSTYEVVERLYRCLEDFASGTFDPGVEALGALYEARQWLGKRERPAAPGAAPSAQVDTAVLASSGHHLFYAYEYRNAPGLWAVGTHESPGVVEFESDNHADNKWRAQAKAEELNRSFVRWAADRTQVTLANALEEAADSWRETARAYHKQRPDMAVDMFREQARLLLLREVVTGSGIASSFFISDWERLRALLNDHAASGLLDEPVERPS